jgi:hypothetical protein
VDFSPREGKGYGSRWHRMGGRGGQRTRWMDDRHANGLVRTWGQNGREEKRARLPS